MTDGRPHHTRARSGTAHPNLNLTEPRSSRLPPRRRPNHVRTPSGSAILQSPPAPFPSGPNHQRSETRVDTINLGEGIADMARQGVRLDTPTTLSGKTGKAESFEPDPASTSSLEVNIHSSDAFGGALVVTNLERIPWGRPGDIVELRPAKSLARGGAGTNLGDPLAPGYEQKRKREKMKGNYMFKLKGNDEMMLKRMPLQSISVSETVSQVFPLINRSEVHLSLIPSTSHHLIEADFIELYFSGQYLGRADMWRLGMSLEENCVFLKQKVEFVGIRAEVKNIYVRGKKRASGLVTSRTKTIFRSKSAQSYIFLQLCKEMFDFDEDGERYYEKALSGFIPELFHRWKNTQANHVVTIILFSRVFYNDAEIQLLKAMDSSGRYVSALQTDPYLGHYKDFYKVIVDFETRQEWLSIMPELKKQMIETHEEILLNYHTGENEAAKVEILGRLSYAYEGNVLECMNLVLNPFDESYIDRDLSRTGLSIVMVTPGVGHFAVNKNLLRLSTERLLDLGITLDLVCLAQLPLHVTPVFSFLSHSMPEKKDAAPYRSTNFGRLQDVLYFDAPADHKGEEEEQYSLAPWVYCSFYSRTHDKPFRSDRFVPRCKMHEIQMLGVIDHDLTTLALPILEDQAVTSSPAHADVDTTSVEAAGRLDMHNKFDDDIFTGHKPRSRGRAESRASTTAIVSPDATDTGTQTPAEMIAKAHQLQAPPAAADVEKTPVVMPERPSLAGITRLRGMSVLSSVSDTSSAFRPALKMKSPPAHEITTLKDTPLSPRSQATGHTTPTIPQIALSRRASDIGPVDIVEPKKIHSIPDSASKTLRTINKRSSKGALSGISDFFRGFAGRGVPVPSVTSFSSIEVEQSSSILSTPTAKPLDPKMPLPGSREAVGQQIVSPSKKSLAQTVSTRDGLLTPGGQLGRSQVEPLAIPHRGNSADKQRSRRRNNLSDDGVDQKPFGSRPAPRSRDKYRSEEGERRTENGEAPAQVAFSFPRDKSGSSFPYGQSYKRSYMSSINPCRPRTRSIEKASKARRWQHALPRPTFTQDMKWDSLCAPSCLPLTNDMVPKEDELKAQYQMTPYHSDCQANQLSFLIRAPPAGQYWDLPIEVLREMASQRLSQNFQFIVASRKAEPGSVLSRGDVSGVRVGGASEVLRSGKGPLFLSTPNSVHRLDFAPDNRNAFNVLNYARRVEYTTSPYNYVCLIWPRMRRGYERSTATFRYPVRNFNYNYLDELISGEQNALTEDLRYWRTRFILIPSERSAPVIQAPTGENLNEQEVHIAGAERVLEAIDKYRWRKPGDTASIKRLKLLPNSESPSVCVKNPLLMQQLADHHTNTEAAPPNRNQAEIGKLSLAEIATAMRDPANRLPIDDNWWYKMAYPETFTGDAFATWLLAMYSDIKSRDAAVEHGRRLQTQGLIEHCNGRHGFLDGYYYYRLTSEYSHASRKRKGLPWFSKASTDDIHATANSVTTAQQALTEQTRSKGDPLNFSKGKKRKRKVKMSRTVILDLDEKRKSDRAEVAILHSDIIHNPNNAFHFELNWIGVTAGLLDDMRQRWSLVAERHGLRLVEAPVEQIKDSGRKCAYRPCYGIKLALAPPKPSELDPKLPEEYRSEHFFEYAILTQLFGFVLDVEAANRYPDDLEVEYSYRKAAIFEHSQFVHRTGLALVQCLGGKDGYIWSENRLFFSASSRYRSESHMVSTGSAGAGPGTGGLGSGVLGTNMTKQQLADQLREELEAFCSDEEKLRAFYKGLIPDVVVASVKAAREGAIKQEKIDDGADAKSVKGKENSQDSLSNSKASLGTLAEVEEQKPTEDRDGTISPVLVDGDDSVPMTHAEPAKEVETASIMAKGLDGIIGPYGL